MSSAVATRFGIYDSHHRKGRHVLVTIAFPEDVGAALVEDLGPLPARYKKIAVAVGAIAETLEDLLPLADARPGPASPPPEFSVGLAVGEIARLVAEVDRLLAELAADPAPFNYRELLDRRVAAARRLVAAQDELTAYFRAHVPARSA